MFDADPEATALRHFDRVDAKRMRRRERQTAVENAIDDWLEAEAENQAAQAALGDYLKSLFAEKNEDEK